MVNAELFLVPELRDDHVRGPEHEGAMEHVRVVLTPVLKLREIDRSGKAFGDVTEVLEQVLELAELAHRGLHRHLPVLLALVHHRVARGGEDWSWLVGIVGQCSLHVRLVEFDFRHRTG